VKSSYNCNGIKQAIFVLLKIENKTFTTHISGYVALKPDPDLLTKPSESKALATFKISVHYVLSWISFVWKRNVSTVVQIGKIKTDCLNIKQVLHKSAIRWAHLTLSSNHMFLEVLFSNLWRMHTKHMHWSVNDAWFWSKAFFSLKTRCVISMVQIWHMPSKPWNKFSSSIEDWSLKINC